MTGLLVTALLEFSPVHAQEAERNPLAGWWAFDEDCPASDNGFGLAASGGASDGRGVYVGRWSLWKERVTIVWNATKSERRHIEASKWRIVENFTLVDIAQERTMLVNIENNARAWLCQRYK
jgi:hypothetical protein